nr:hypothetical protein [Tanacetum cinerariifolium]
ESAVGQRAVLCPAGGGCTAYDVLARQAEDLVHAHRMATRRCRGPIPHDQAGFESVPQIRCATEPGAAAVRRHSVRAVHPARQLSAVQR